MTGRLSQVEIDETAPSVASAEMEQERRVAVFDLLEENRFALVEGPDGPYRLRLGLTGRRLAFAVMPEVGEAIDFTLALGPLEQAVKDYVALCDSYADAVKTLPPARIEAADAARRAIHLEAARQLQTRLADRVRIDEATARRLFTLICALAAHD